MYDFLMRVPLLSWASYCALKQIVGLIHFIKLEKLDAVYLIHLASRLSVLAFLLLLVIATILRTRPSNKASGLEPRISALVGTFLIYGIVLFPQRELSLSLEIISTLLIIVGTIGAIVALSRLGRSFSVMAETRQLVTSGPYRLVRHPLYLTEEIAIFGMFMQFASIWTVLILALQITFQLRRIHNEEAILTEAFPEYSMYREATNRLIPGVW